MKRKHFAINSDEEFLKKMTSLRFFLNEKSDGNVLKECVERVYSTFNKVNKVKSVNKVNTVNNINDVIKVNFVKTKDVTEGSLTTREVSEILGLQIATNKLAEILKNLGFEKKRTSKDRFWLMKKK